jgi:hypothetical protein
MNTLERGEVAPSGTPAGGPDDRQMAPLAAPAPPV